MKTNLKFVRPAAAGLGLLAMAGIAPAFAADVVMEQPPEPAAPMETAPLNTWSGPYAGVTLGYGLGGRTNLPGNEINTSGFIAGGFAGYQLQNGGFVYGAEADIGYNGIKGDDGGVSSKSGVDGTLRARLGYAPNDSVLVYATAGGAAERRKLSDGVSSDSNTLLGWTAGAGVDAKVTERVFGRVEYRYTDYASKDFDLSGGSVSADTTNHKIMVGMGVKF